MAAGPRERVHRTRPTGRLARRLTWSNDVLSVLALGCSPRGEPFDPTSKPASEYQRGLAFGAATIMRQIDAGVPANRIQDTQEAAKLTLLAAARNDGEREFCAG
jgi:hypothetical protein